MNGRFVAGVTVACYAAQTRHNNPVGATRDAATRLKYNTRRGAGGVSNERNGASRGVVMKSQKTSPPIGRKEKGGLRANLAVRPYPIYRSTRASRAITPSLSFTYAGRYPVVYELFSLSGRRDTASARAGLDCLYGVVFTENHLL